MNRQDRKKAIEIAQAMWDRLDRMIDDHIEWQKREAKEGRHNYGICQLCRKEHFVEFEPELPRKGVL